MQCPCTHLSSDESATSPATGTAGTPDIHEVTDRRGLRSFIEFPLELYKGDANYVPQLTRDLLKHFSSRNPFMSHADVKFFIARMKGSICGRVASIVNHEHVAYHGERAGFFGFFESVQDRAVSGALLGRVESELRQRGMDLMQGPMNFSTNEDCGIMIEGFQERPMLMTPYNPPYYADLMEEAGMAKVKDLFAFIHEVLPELPEKVLRVAALAGKRGITVRHLDKSRFLEDMGSFRDVYNSAWKKNWGFIPLSGEELRYDAGRLKPLVVSDLVIIAEHRGIPVGFLGMVPDFNIVLQKMRGRLTLPSILKALYYSRRIPDLRLLLYGIREEYRNKGVDALLFMEGFKGVKRGSYRRVEFSWILEENIPVILIAQMFGGRLYKKYRIYEKKLT